MGFFTRKPEIHVTDFVCNFFTAHVFETASDFSERTLELLRAVDDVFMDIDPDQFSHELLALRCEVVSTAWTHVFNDETSLTVSQVTRDVVGQVLWERMSHYNRMLAWSAVHGADSKTGLGRVRIVFVNKTRADFFDTWHPRGFDGEAIARAANRFGTQDAWKTGTAQSYLIKALSRRLGLTREPDSDDEPCKTLGFNCATAFGEIILDVVSSLYEKARLAAKGVRVSF